ncbi:hypothetical protein ACF1G5_23330 [Streptomyces coeruleorubidus]|uniref:hypothetical protein n=1 Tax=Streptomyces coeruleorubidus TaxID=116188 RepID=UPI0036FBA2DC
MGEHRLGRTAPLGSLNPTTTGGAACYRFTDALGSVIGLGHRPAGARSTGGDTKQGR